VEYQLLNAFRGVFEGKKYLHRNANLGDHVAAFLYEDLLALDRSPKLIARIKSGRAAVNAANKTVGKRARRGDGTFGEVVPGTPVVGVAGFLVPRGQIAAVEVGAETKILAKAMMKQIERVETALIGQTAQFKRSNRNAITVAFVGINYAPQYLSFEGTREFPTDGKKYKHPIQEASEAEKRLMTVVQPHFDEFVLLKYRVSNQPPYPFEWMNEAATKLEYAAALARISKEYEARF